MITKADKAALAALDEDDEATVCVKLSCGAELTINRFRLDIWNKPRRGVEILVEDRLNFLAVEGDDTWDAEHPDYIHKSAKMAIMEWSIPELIDILQALRRDGGGA